MKRTSASWSPALASAAPSACLSARVTSTRASGTRSSSPRYGPPVPKLDRLLLRLAPVGVAVFLVGYAIAVPMYPGGSPFDRSHPGYDLADNYLCDAFRARAYDGRPNELGAAAGQIGMLGLVVAAAAALFAAPGTFRDAAPRLALLTRAIAALAFVGMMLVPLTPAHEYGMLHFASVGLASIPSLSAAYAGAFGVLQVARDGDRYGRPFRILTLATVVACTIHFGQYLAQVTGLVGENVWVPRVQKVVVLIVVVWIGSLSAWALRRQQRLS